MDEDMWEIWFSNQWELNERIRKAIDGLMKDQPAQMRIAMWTSVIETAAEELRNALPE